MFQGMFANHLTLLVGQGLPRPVAARWLEQWQSAEIAVSDRERSGFELVFDAPRAGGLISDFPILSDPALKAGSRLIAVATLGLMPQVLIDGIIETAEFVPSQGEGPARLKLRGKDLLTVMDRVEREAVHPAQGPGEIAALTILSYATQGLIPLVIPPVTADRPNPVELIPAQRGTDFAYLTDLAQRHDHIFTLIPGPLPGQSTAYWGPLPRLGVPQRAITTDMGPDTNVSALNFEAAEAGAASVSGQVQDPASGASIPVVSTVPLRPPLAANPSALAPAAARRLFRTNGAPSGGQAMGEAQAQADATSDTVTVTGDLDTWRYGAVLAPRGLVGLRGAGLAQDGLYYVRSVIHKIARGSWVQSFTLNREGLGTTTPVVRP
jgi:hypothetical protein